MSIKVENLCKQFGTIQAADHVNFEIESGALVALLGPSGCGKSVLLRMIAGLEIPDSGEIRITGQLTTRQSTQERNVGFVFQHYALFRHMNVWDNIAFGLDVRKVPRKERDERVKDLVKLVLLDGYEKHYPWQLSGGQRQRVALARALAPHPQILLLDEPFGALDTRVREELRGWIVRLHEQTHVTTLFVTHDQHEALEVAKRILVMNRGRIEQEGTPREVFSRPLTPFVAEFVGQSNFVEAVVNEMGIACWGPFRFPVKNFTLGQKVQIFFRPHDVVLSARPVSEAVSAKILHTVFKGPFIEHTLDIGGGRQVIAQIPEGLSLTMNLTTGQNVFIQIPSYQTFPI